MVAKKSCYEHDGYFSLQKEVETLVKERLVKENAAQKYFAKLPFFIWLMSKFPFVRGIAISGSLSKNVMFTDGDIDYFIITAPDRLWICRTFLVLFKKIFLLNSKKYFCVNYFVDENNLEIIDKNIFTAIELSYLYPVFNKGLFNRLENENSWTKEYFSNFNHPLNGKIKTNENKKRKGLEIFFFNNFANRFDLWLMKLTFKQWKKKFKHFDKHKLELTMRTNRGISKHHPQDFQNKVLAGLEERMAKLQA